MCPMKLPVMPPVPPMLAKSVATIPPGASYEPKWDGFRTIVFRDADEVELGSRNERPMTRYFPELIEAVKKELPERCVVDGEIVIATDDGLDFEALQQRIHPAVSRVTILSTATPASNPSHDGSGRGPTLVHRAGGGRARWRSRETARRHLPTRQAGHVQDQARPYRRLCRRRLPGA
jgi:ATP dependent DNA ligase domain